MNPRKCRHIDFNNKNGHFQLFCPFSTKKNLNKYIIKLLTKKQCTNMTNKVFYRKNKEVYKTKMARDFSITAFVSLRKETKEKKKKKKKSVCQFIPRRLRNKKRLIMHVINLVMHRNLLLKKPTTRHVKRCGGH